MATYNLPKNWNAFNAWFTNFQKAFNTNAKKYGFSTTEVKAFNQFYKNWQNSYSAWNSFNAFSKTVNTFHANEFMGCQTFVQSFISTIQSNKSFNGNWNSFFGTSTTVKKSTVKKSTAKKATAKKVATTSTSTPIKAVSTTTKKTTRTSPRAKTTRVTPKATVKKVVSKTTKRVSAAKKATATKTVRPTTAKRTSVRAKSTTTKPIAKKTTIKKTVAKKTTIKKPIASKTTATKRTPVRSTKSTVNKNVVAKSSPPTISSNAPFMWFSSGKSGVNVYVGSTKNGNFNLPTGTKGAYVEVKNTGKRWTKLTQGASFPFVHNYNGNGKLFYRACWINSSGKKGSFSSPISFTQNATKAAA